MDCLDEAAVLALVEDRVAAAARRAVERHLDACGSCLELVTQTRLALGSARPAPPGLADAVAASDALDRYQLGPELARGGMGRIVAAHDRRLDRPVVVKVALDRAPETAARFVREIALTSRLEHPAIVPVHDAGTLDDGTPFYAMRMIGGESFDKVITRADGLAGRLALVPHVLAVADAVAYVHARGVLHRDLKPHNILVGEFGETVLIDWGLAKDLGDADHPALAPASAAAPATATVLGTALGTPAYMAPEQLAAESVDRRADVYGLGATLYHTLTGRPPHGANRAVGDRPRPIAAIEPGVPVELAAIVARAMAPAAADRYASALELAGDLRRFAAGQLVLAHRYSLAQRVARRVRRHRAAFAIAALAVVALTALSITGVRRIIAERRRADQARVEAERQRDGAQRLVAFMLGDLRDNLDRLGRLDLLRRASAEVRAYYTSAGPRAAVTPVQLADAAKADGDAKAAAGDPAGATAAYRAGLDDLAAAPADDDAAASMRCDLELVLGDALRATGDAGAAGSYRACDARAQAALTARPADRAWQLQAAKAKTALAELAGNAGDRATARLLADAADALLPSLIDHDDARGTALTAQVRLDLMRNAWAMEAFDWATAATTADRALASARDLTARFPDDIRAAWALTSAWDRVGKYRARDGDQPGAMAAFERARAGAESLVAREPRNARYQRTLGMILDSLGRAALARGDPATARTYYAASRDVSATLAELAPRDVALREELGISEFALGDAQRRDDRVAARATYQRAIAAFEAARALAPAEPRLIDELSRVYGRLAEFEDDGGDRAASRAAIETSLGLARTVLAQTPSPEAQQAVAERLVFLAYLDRPRAAELLTEAVALVEPLRGRTAGDAYLTAFLADLDLELARATRAR
ncbi:MAG: serine/threonine protein kinase [Myxococcales bacterium]|nr:serine/threonine protein kinase [Myxococcales bacterium]MBP6844464.1 serine/threonine protein kinase [Kofleriaceae bacterium]